LNGNAKVIIILVSTSEKLRKMANFVVVFKITLFENNQHYVKFDMAESIPTIAKI
jgi:hypothetical protein